MTTQIDNWERTFHCGECESEFTSVGYDNPVFYADKVADCPKCGSKCWETEQSVETRTPPLRRVRDTHLDMIYKFYSKTFTDLKEVKAGSEKSITIELNTTQNKRNVDYILTLDAIGETGYKLTLLDYREGSKKKLVEIDGELGKVKECKHEFDRYDKCVVCGKRALV